MATTAVGHERAPMGSPAEQGSERICYAADGAEPINDLRMTRRSFKVERCR